MTTFTLPSDHEMQFVHTFDAPRDRVFEVMYDAKHVPNWWGPRRLRTVVEKLDFRPNGTWRFLQYDTDGTLYAFNGSYLEIDAPSRVVSTFEYEGAPGRVTQVTTTFDERDGKTTVTTHQRFPTSADRDGMMNAGAEGGFRESMERLSELLA